MKHVLIIDGVVKQVQPNKQEGFIEVEDNVVCGMMFDGIDFTTPEQSAEVQQANLIAHYKSLYLGVVDAKLRELDYDSLATVKLWEGDATFGAEASKILAWYKSIIAYNYALLTAGPPPPTDEAYLAGIPVYV